MPPKAPDKKVNPKQVIRVHEGRKKKHEEAEGNSERWLLTYADMITLLLALFIILFAISTPNKVKYDQLAKEMSGGFGGESPTNTPAHGPQPGKVTQPNVSVNESTAKIIHAAAKAAAAAAAQKVLQKKIQSAAAKLNMQKQVIVKRTARGLVISLLTDRATFASGSAVLQPSAQHLLMAIGPFFAHINNEIRVEGNTDNIPIATADYPTNWELSTARAVVVTRFLSEQVHLQPERLSAAGYGQYKPQEANDTEAHRQLNRRVDIVILNTRLTEETEKSQSDDVGTVTR